MKTVYHFLAIILVAGVTAHAQVVTPNPKPTIITTAPYTITTPGFYQLGANLTIASTSGNIITIAASNVTLDFGGHYISGPVNASSQLVGVYASEEGNLTIRNGTIAYCRQGIFLNGNGTPTSLNINQQINNMLVTYCYNVGIVLDYANDSVYANNRISFIGGTNSAFGILDVSTGGNQATNNVVTNVTTSGTGNGVIAIGIASAASAPNEYASGTGTLAAFHNTVSYVTNTATNSQAVGIDSPILETGNIVLNCYVEVGWLGPGALINDPAARGECQQKHCGSQQPPDGRPTVHRAHGEKRMQELGFTNFSQYLAYLIVRDVERSSEQVPEKKIRVLRIPPGAVPPGQAKPGAGDKRAQAADKE